MFARHSPRSWEHSSLLVSDRLTDGDNSYERSVDPFNSLRPLTSFAFMPPNLSSTNTCGRTSWRKPFEHSAVLNLPRNRSQHRPKPTSSPNQRVIAGVLGRRDGRVVLRQLEDRILLPTRVAHDEERSNGSRQVGRGPL